MFFKCKSHLNFSLQLTKEPLLIFCTGALKRSQGREHTRQLFGRLLWIKEVRDVVIEFYVSLIYPDSRCVTWRRTRWHNIYHKTFTSEPLQRAGFLQACIRLFAGRCLVCGVNRRFDHQQGKWDTMFKTPVSTQRPNKLKHTWMSGWGQTTIYLS